MVTTSSDVLAPKVLIVPTVEPASSVSKASPGSLFISGAKLYVFVTEGACEKVTST